VQHINVRMISQGASEINMSFMIDEDDVDEAVRSLHRAFFADPDPDVFDVAERIAAGGPDRAREQQFTAERSNA
jgi:aspartate kinase